MIRGWNQQKLKDSKLAIIGSGHLANFISASAAALGVGDIKIYDNARVDNEILGKPYSEREFLMSQARQMSSKAESLEKRVKMINPLINICGIHMSLDSMSESFMEKPDLMIIANNDGKEYINYAEKKKIPYYHVVSTEEGAKFDRKEVEDLEYRGKEQDAITSEVISGLLVGEATKFLMEGNSVNSLSYYPSGNRFSKPEKVGKADLRNKKVLVIGAGALGNFLGIGLAHSDVGKIYLADDDDIEVTNLNRQIMFYDSVGQMKAEVLGKRLMEINPRIKVEPMLRRVNEDFEKTLRKMKPDAIIDCVDNLSTRAILNHFAMRYQIPLISGGTNYQAGQVVVYSPERSSCLNCKLGVDKAFVEARRASSCIHAPTPSVVVSNHIIGGLMAAEARMVLDSKYGEAVKQTIKYDSTKPVRVGLIGSSAACDCKRNYSAREWSKRLLSDKAEKAERDNKANKTDKTENTEKLVPVTT